MDPPKAEVDHQDGEEKPKRKKRRTHTHTHNIPIASRQARKRSESEKDDKESEEHLYPQKREKKVKMIRHLNPKYFNRMLGTDELCEKMDAAAQLAKDSKIQNETKLPDLNQGSLSLNNLNSIASLSFCQRIESGFEQKRNRLSDPLGRAHREFVAKWK